jgi:flagellar assembly factor FliW
MSAASIDGVVTFAGGLPGFETARRFVLVASPALQPFTLVQGIDGGAPSFVAIDPRLVDDRYCANLEAGDLARLGATTSDTLLWLALVSAGPDNEVATVNLRAPLVVNPVSMCGIQLFATDSPYRIDHPLPE